MEAKLVAVIVCTADHVVDDEVRGTGPPSAVVHNVVSHVRSSLQEWLGHSKQLTLPHGSRLSCGALVKKQSLNILRAPPASSACWAAAHGQSRADQHRFFKREQGCSKGATVKTHDGVTGRVKRESHYARECAKVSGAN